MPFVKQCVRKEVRLAQAARAPGQAARTAAGAAAATATAAPAASASTAAAATMAAAAAATARNLHEVPGAFLVEQVERRQTHIGDLFLAEGDGVAR